LEDYSTTIVSELQPNLPTGLELESEEATTVEQRTITSVFRESTATGSLVKDFEIEQNTAIQSKFSKATTIGIKSKKASPMISSTDTIAPIKINKTTLPSAKLENHASENMENYTSTTNSKKAQM